MHHRIELEPVNMRQTALFRDEKPEENPNREIKESKSTQKTTLVGFFCGTGFSPNPKEAKEKHYSFDYSFNDLAKKIERNEKARVHSYSGCQVNGGGAFARGIEVPCDHFFNEVVKAYEEQLKNGNREKIKLHMIAQSRGCLSVLMLVKKINAIPYLRDQVEFVLDLRDPVPGNLLVTTKVDLAETCIATQLRSLKECSNVKEVNITLDESTPPAGFSALIPEFHPDTRVNIEMLPSRHGRNQNYVNSAGYALAHAKSLECMLKHDIPLNDKTINIPTLQEEQLKNYNFLLIDAYNNRKKINSRDIHFGGEFKRDITASSTSLNPRHAELKGEPHNGYIYAYVGDRPEIKYSYILNRQINLFLNNLRNQLTTLTKKISLPREVKKLTSNPLELAHNALVYTHTQSLSTNIAWIRDTLGIQARTTADVDHIRSQMLLAIRTSQNSRLTAKHDLIEALRQSIILRTQKKLADRSEYGSFFGRITGMSATVKINAAQAMLDILQGKASTLSEQNIKALKDGKLGALMKYYFHSLPPLIKDKFNNHKNKIIQAHSICKMI